MNSIKCPHCNLTNWASDETCKRCKLPLAGADDSSLSNPAAPGYASRENWDRPVYAPARPAELKQGMAIASMVLGLVGCAAAPVGLILGIIAWSRANKRPMEYGGKGFAIAGVCLSGVGLFSIPVIAAIAIPNLLAARRAANEGSTISAMRTIASAQETYNATTLKGCAELGTLGSSRLIDEVTASGTRSGYRLEVVKTADNDCQINARPLVVRGSTSTGIRSFFSSRADGWRIHAADKHGEPATVYDATLGTDPRAYSASR